MKVSEEAKRKGRKPPASDKKTRPGLTIVVQKSFKKDLDSCRANPKRDIKRLMEVINTIAARRPLDVRHRDHPLVGKWKGVRDCHVKPDWLLLYYVDGDDLVLVRTHAELFD